MAVLNCFYISAIVSDVVYGQDLVVSHVLNVSDAVGSVVYFVDGKRVGNSSVGSSINVSALKAGLHTVFVKLVDDVNYMDDPFSIRSDIAECLKT